MRYYRVAGVEAAPMLDEVVLFNPATRKFCILNPTAAHLWDSLEAPHTADELTQSMCATFDGANQPLVERDVRSALGQLVELGIVGADDSAH